MRERLTLEVARKRAEGFLRGFGMPIDHARMVADHIVYAHLAGHAYAGFSRLPAIGKMLRQRGVGGTIATLRETQLSCTLDGGDINGYVTSIYAMDRAIGLAKRSGVGIVGLRNSWFSGLLRYYVERATDAGLIGIHAANSTARVAPAGGIDALLGTNPICAGFPADNMPLIIDLATAATMWGDLLYHQQVGQPIKPGHAIDRDGYATTDPAEALAGAILPWGGARGSAISVLVQALGIWGGSDPVISEAGVWGYVFLVIDPEMLMSAAEFRRNVATMRARLEGARSQDAATPVRAPGSATQRRIIEGRQRGWIEIDAAVLDAVDTARAACH